MIYSIRRTVGFCLLQLGFCASLLASAENTPPVLPHKLGISPSQLQSAWNGLDGGARQTLISHIEVIRILEKAPPAFYDLLGSILLIRDYNFVERFIEADLLATLRHQFSAIDNE